MAAAGIAGAAVVFGADRFREDDRALLAQALDQNMVARRDIDVVRGVAAGGRAHVLGVERILEREDDSVHRQFVERRIAAVTGVERSGGFERIGEVAELVADRRRARRQRPQRGMPVELAPAGDGTFAADVQGREGIELAGVVFGGDGTETFLAEKDENGVVAANSRA